MRDFTFGFLLSLSIGPVALLIVNYAVRLGIRVALYASLGASLADGVYATLAFSFGNRVASNLGAHLMIFKLTGGVILILLGARMLWALREVGPVKPTGTQAFPCSSVFLMTLSNPMTVFLFLGYAIAPATVSSGPIFRSSCVIVGSLFGQSFFAVGGSLIRALTTSKRVIVATRLASAIGVVLYGFIGLAKQLIHA